MTAKFARNEGGTETVKGWTKDTKTQTYGVTPSRTSERRGKVRSPTFKVGRQNWAESGRL